MPVTVDTVAVRNMIGWSHQRHLFYAKGLFWIFYTDGTNLVWRTSEDAINWSAKTTIISGGEGYFKSVVLDGDYVHLAFAGGGGLYYRRGTLGSDGGITWNDWQTAYSAANVQNKWPAIAVDSEGYPWIGFHRTHTVDGTDYPYVTKSSKKDGTWVTDTGFPYELKALSGGYMGAVPVPLTGGKVYVLYGAFTPVYGKLYDSGWSSEETITSKSVRGIAFSGVADGDDVYLTYTSRENALLTEHRYLKRTYGVGWGSEEVLRNTGYYEYYAQLSRDADTGILYFICIEDTTVYLYRNVAGTWEEAVSWILNEDTSALGALAPPTCVYLPPEKQGRHIPVAWTAGDSDGPWNLRFAVLTLLPSSLKSNSHTL
jgi:hypothetical protein